MNVAENRKDPKEGTVALICFTPNGRFSIRAIHAYLKGKGIGAAIIFIPLKGGNIPTIKEEKLLFQLLKDLNVYLIGMTVESPLVQTAAHITVCIRKALNIPVIWGGVHPTLLPEKSLEIADIICVGDGEEAMYELADAIQRGKDIHSILNLWGRTEEGIWKNPLRPLIIDIDDLPFPDFNDRDKYVLDHNKITYGEPLKRLKKYAVRVSRGCSFNCGYCSYEALREKSMDKKRYYRKRSPENIIQELKRAVQEIKGLKLIKIDEPLSFKQNPWLEEFAERYRKEINIPMEVEWFPGSFDPQVVSMLVQAGVKRVVIGIESGSEHIRSTVFKRSGTNEQIMEFAKALHARGVHLGYNFVLDNCFENHDNRKETLEMILNLPRGYGFSFLALFMLQFYPETAMTRTALEKNLITCQDIEGNGQRSVTRWHARIDQFRFDKDKYYACLSILVSIKYFPLLFSKILYRTGLFRKNTTLLILFLRDVLTGIRP